MSSISFGREDARVHSGDTKDSDYRCQNVSNGPLAACNNDAAQGCTPVTRRQKQCRIPGNTRMADSRQVARQLDFDSEFHGAAGPSPQRSFTGHFPNEQIIATVPVRKGQIATPACCGGTQHLAGYVPERDTSANCASEIGGSTTSPTLLELSPLVSPDAGLHGATFLSPASVAATCGSFSDKGAQWQESQSCNQSAHLPALPLQEKSHSIENSPICSQMLPWASKLEAYGLETPRGSVVLQLRLCKCGRGVQLQKPTGRYAAECRCDQEGANVKESVVRRGRSEELLRSCCSPPQPEPHMTSGESMGCPKHGHMLRSLSSPHLLLSSTTSIPKEEHRFGDVRNGIPEASLDELQKAVRGLRTRYLDRFLRVRP